MSVQILPPTLKFTRARTLCDMLHERAAGPQGADIRFLHLGPDDVPPGRVPEGDDGCVAFSYAEVLDVARRAAAHLQKRGIGRGDRVLIVLPTGPSFMAAYFGCTLLGAVPVPVVPPLSLNRMDDHIARIARIARVGEAAAVVCHERLLAVFRVARGRHKDARAALENLIVGSELLREEEAFLERVTVDPEAPAMIQFTSGSTGDPKGVVLPHRALLANIQAIGEAAGFCPGDVALAWLPLFHDMGLIGHFLAAPAWGLPLVLIPPEVFIKRPREWLKAITRYRGSCSAAPNFAYSLCTKKIRERDLEGLDLSSWRVAFCGAEPINHETVVKFIERFEPAGFRPGTFYPVYGMAEFSLAATFPPPGRPPVFDRISRHRFERDGVAVPAGEGESPVDTCVWISVGSAMPGHQVRVVDRDGNPLPDRHQGDIEVFGPSRMEGYYKAPVATAEALRDGWLRTGDLGYLADGELYVTGRRKEIIIKGGKNLYPQDVEAAAARVPGVRVGCCAAFGVTNEKRGTEDLVLVCETRASDAESRASMMSAIRAAVLEAIGATPDVVVLVEPGTVPKTSSGKIQRDLMRQRYRANDMKPGRASLFTLVRLKVFDTLERVRMSRIARLTRPLRRLAGAGAGR